MPLTILFIPYLAFHNNCCLVCSLIFLPSLVAYQGTKIFQYCTCPVGRVTYNFHSSCKHMYLAFKSVCNKEHKGVICNMTSQSKHSSGIFVPCLYCKQYGPQSVFIVFASMVKVAWFRGYKTFILLSSIEHEISTAHKN